MRAPGSKAIPGSRGWEVGERGRWQLSLLHVVRVPGHPVAVDSRVLLRGSEMSSQDGDDMESEWVVGEMADRWMQSYAKGRADSDFAAMIGMCADHVVSRWRVWARFGETKHQFPSLVWSHFFVALEWDDAETCLKWANENAATVAEMKAWRRAMRGEDLTEPESTAGGARAC